MSDDPHAGLSAREREVMDIVYRLTEATAADVREEMVDAPTDATVRSTLRVLEEKGWLEHRRLAGRYRYRPTRDPRRVRERMLGHLMSTFFDNSPAAVVAALVDRRGARLRSDERERLQEILARLETEEEGG